MGIEDNDMIDRALDAVESRMAESEVEAPEVETEAEEAPTTQESSKEDKVEQAVMKQALDKSKKPIKAPKKAKEQVSDQVADVEQSEEAQEVASTEVEPVSTQVEAAPPIDLPAFWSADEKAALAKAPREVMEIVARKEAQRNEFAQRLATESERGRAIEARISEVIKPYETKLKAQGVKDPLELFERQLAWNDLFTADRASVKRGLADLMQKNGLTPEDFYDVEDSQSVEPQTDPRVEEALREAKEAKESFQSWQSEQQKRALMSEVESFKNGKDSTGQVRKAFVEMYEPQIAQAVSAMKAQNPQLTNEQALSSAYEWVVGEARKAFGVSGSKLPTSQPDVKKIQAASGSITGAPANGAATPRAKLKGKNFNEKIDSALDNAFDAVGL